MSKSLSRTAGLLVVIAAAAWAPAPEDKRDATTAVAEQIKGLIPEAASSPNREWKRIGQGTATTIDAFESQPLSLVLVFLPPPGAKNDPARKDFQFLTGDAGKIATAISRSMARGYGSVIQADDITGVTCKVKGKEATGAVNFRAEGICEGCIHYTARLGDRGWVVEEFRLPNYKVRVTRNAGGVWKQTRIGGKE